MVMVVMMRRVCVAGLRALLLSALLHAAAPRGARDRPRQCDPPQAQSDMNSFLWTVKRAPPLPPSYLFGTIHVPYTRVWDFIPDASKRAFRVSPNVYFELDLTDPLTISKLTSCQLLPHGENLQTLLPRDLYRRLKRHLDYVKHMMPHWMTADQRGRGLYADYLFNAIAGNWERKRPVWVMLMVNSLTEWDVRSRGTPVLDLYLAQEAERTGKRTGAVERVEEQCHPLNGLNFSQVKGCCTEVLERRRHHALTKCRQVASWLRHRQRCRDLTGIGGYWPVSGRDDIILVAPVSLAGVKGHGRMKPKSGRAVRRLQSEGLCRGCNYLGKYVENSISRDLQSGGSAGRRQDPLLLLLLH
ncbi:Metalloprotease TIKI2 [Merluccius polli]|uniref:Metalloprotease TIKI n=1 Tax=Merluccius polli TaxID=89951 RepID=A0AA47MWP7_MERPO|nr:Metalloprotease TIKI2 [Merluccius polli]